MFMRLGGVGDGVVQSYPHSVTLLRIERKSECEVNSLAVSALFEIFSHFRRVPKFSERQRTFKFLSQGTIDKLHSLP